MEVQLSFSGAPSAIGKALVGLGEALLQVEEVEEVKAVEPAMASGWDNAKVRAVWDYVTEDGRKALAVMAKNPEGVTPETLMREVGVEGGKALGGKMATIGFGRRHVGMPYGPYDTRADRYIMSRDVAGIILAIIAETGWSG